MDIYADHRTMKQSVYLAYFALNQVDLDFEYTYLTICNIKPCVLVRNELFHSIKLGQIKGGFEILLFVIIQSYYKFLDSILFYCRRFNKFNKVASSRAVGGSR